MIPLWSGDDDEHQKWQESALQLLRAHPEITVLICVNDVVAVGALQAAKELCLRVPEDLSITGFDGIPFTQLTTPRITTICTPRYEMGRLGTTVLLDAVDGVREPSDKSEFIPSILMPGESIAGPRKGIEICGWSSDVIMVDIK